MSTTISGFHAIKETLEVGADSACLHVSGRGPRIEELIALARSKSVEVRSESDSMLDRLCGHRNHRGAVLETADPVFRERRSVREICKAFQGEQALVVILDGVTDPQNLGAVMRSADQFAADLLILPRRRAAHETEAVARASAGAHVYVPVVVASNLTTALEELKEFGFWIYGAAAGGKPASSLDLCGRTAIVFGGEGRGLGRLLRERCDEIVGIASRGHVDSFNVSVAAGILMYEVRRQQWKGLL